MNSPDARIAGWYHLLAASLDNPAAQQQLNAIFQRANQERTPPLDLIGTPDPAEAHRFLQLAHAVNQGRMMQTELGQKNHAMMLEQADGMRDQGRSTRDMMERFKKGILHAIADAEVGYGITKWMYLILFGLGVLLVLGAAICGVMGIGATWGAGLVFVGGASTVAALLFRQQKALESSRVDLLQLQISVTAWLDNIVRFSGAVGVMSQTTAPTPELLAKIWDQSRQSTTDVLDMLQTYCEDRPRRPFDRGRGPKAPPAQAAT
ncbi:MAG: hypothetical protein JNL39_06390 [Opitutaceae bacterium]|nr:hypothetical protein [Opitutaceae bacterium]